MQEIVIIVWIFTLICGFSHDDSHNEYVIKEGQTMIISPRGHIEITEAQIEDSTDVR